MTLQFSCGFAIHTKTGSMCLVIRFLFWFIKKTAWFLRRFFMVFFNSNAVFTTFEHWTNSLDGVGAETVRRSFHNQTFFATIHGWHLVSKFLRYCRHVLEFQHVQDCRRFFWNLAVKFQIVFLRPWKEIHCFWSRNQSNLIYSCRPKRLLNLFFRFQILGSCFEFWKVPWLSCRKIKINSQIIINKQIHGMVSKIPMFDFFHRNKQGKVIHKLRVYQIAGSRFEKIFIFQCLWRFCFLLRF